MGLSLIAPAPDADQQLKYLNSMGAFATMSLGQWMGESSLNSLGLADGDPSQGAQQATQVIDAIGNTAIRLKEAGVFGGNRNKNRGHPNPIQHGGGPAPMSMTSGAGGGGLPSWVIWGGGILVVGLLLYVLMKKKKGGRDHDEPHFEKGE